MKNNKLKKLIKKYKLIDPTAFIEDLLRQDHQLKYINGLTNMSWYKTRISKGKFKGTNVQYLRILKKMQFEMDTSSNDILKEQIRKDITTIEDSYKGERKVKQWYTLPCWMGKVMMRLFCIVKGHVGGVKLELTVNLKSTLVQIIKKCILQKLIFYI